MANIDFGTGANTASGDFVSAALAKVEARCAALEAAGVAVTSRGVVYDGDSITEGPDQTWLHALPSRPTILANLTGLPIQNLGVSGRRLQEMDSSFASRGVAALYNASTTNTLLLLAGINDILNNGATLAQLKTWMTSYCAKATAAGFRLFLGTVLPTKYAGFTAGMEVIRNAFNAWLVISYKTLGAAGVVDYAALLEAQDPDDTLYYHDKLHPTVRLLGIMTRLDAVAIGVPLTQLVINPNLATGLGGWFGYSYNFANFTPIGPDQARLSNPTAGRMRLTGAADATYAEAHTPVTGLIPGASYTLSWEITALFAAGASQFGARARIGNVLGESGVAPVTYPYADNATNQVKTAAGVYTATFVATARTHYFVIQNFSETTGSYVEVDTLSIVLG